MKKTKAASNRLKHNKAAGVNGVEAAEFVLDTAPMLLTPLVMTFSQTLQKGTGVPSSGCNGLIHPYFKARNNNDFESDSDIAMAVVLSKMHAFNEIIVAHMIGLGKEPSLRYRLLSTEIAMNFYGLESDIGDILL